MGNRILLGLVVAVAVVGLATLGLTLYTKQEAPAEAEAIRHFLRAALSADTTELRKVSLDQQPIAWALAAAAQDSAAVEGWTRRGTLVRAAQSHDTLIVTLSHSGSVRECSYFGTLTGAFVEKDGVRRLTRLSAVCPEVRSKEVPADSSGPHS